MNNIRIITDSAADLTAEELDRLGVECVPMTVAFGSEEYTPGVDLTNERFYELLCASESFPTTAQPAPAAFEERFLKAREEGCEVVAILISSALSGTWQSARIAAQGMEGVYVVDSLTVTAGQKLLIERAAALRDEGRSAAEIALAIESLKGRVRIYVGVESLEYLYKGGRLSKAAAGIGTMAGIKPVITINQRGEVAVQGKCIGKHRAMDRIAKAVEETEREDAPVRVLYTAGTGNAEELAGRLKKAGVPIEEEFMLVGSTVGAHAGPNAYAVAFFAKK